MEKNTLYVSDCCNAESNVDHEICSQCGEHCTIIVDDSIEADYIPGYDDGEWGTDEDCCGEEDFAWTLRYCKVQELTSQ